MTSSSLYSKTRAIMGSQAFFWGVLVLFVVSALWIAFSARYPMAFDENYHFGVIKAYSHQISPFISHAPTGTESLGDITRYPSYLFHYLLSFPYRLTQQFNTSEQTTIIALRTINISFFAVGLIYFKKLLKLSGAGKALSNLTLLFFVLIPNVIFLAAQINYDNLLVLLTAVVLYLCLRFIQAVEIGKIETILLIQITALNLLASLVVFTYLPILFATQLFIIGYAVITMKRHSKPLFKNLSKNFRTQKPVMKWTFVALLITGLVLFGERYGINQIKFNNLIPHCGQILPASSCKQYGPWGRDFKLMQKPPSTWSDGRYFLQWAGQNMYEFFFTINYNYFNKAPLPLPFAAAWIATIAGTVAAAWQWKRLRANVAFVFFGFIVAVFSISLWINNLHRFRTVGFPVAIHGRYWVQLLPIIFVLMAVGIKYTVNDLPKRYIQPVSLTVLFGTLVLFSQGGGISSYILKSDASWYWPNTPMIEANDHTRSVLQKVIIN